jgi:DNA-binding transcriptional LysR family regulator
MNISEIDLNLLVTLDALLTEQSVSRAARRLHRSQPAVSAALARLRVLLNDPLLARHGSAMLVTPYARTLGDPIRRILCEIEHTLAGPAPFEPARSSRTFRIATTDYSAFTLFPGLMRRIRKEAPGVRIELWPLTDDVGERLEAGALDLAVADDWGLRHLPRRQQLWSERFVCLVRRNHPRIRRSLTLERFLAEKHALVSARGRVSGNVDDVLRKLGRTRDVALTLPHFLAVPAIIAETDLVVTLADRIARRFAESERVRLLKPPFEVTGFEVSMAWDPAAEGDAAVDWMRAEVATRSS